MNKEEKEEILPYTATSQLYAKEKRNLLDELQLPLGIHVCLSPTKHTLVQCREGRQENHFLLLLASEISTLTDGIDAVSLRCILSSLVKPSTVHFPVTH